jgi:hypothetical protein
MCRTHKHKQPVLAKQTQLLLKYIESRPILPFRLSNTSQKCLSQIIQMVHHSSVHTPSYELRDIPSTEMTEWMTTFKNTNESQMIPPSIWTGIQTAKKIGRLVTAQLYGRTIRIYLILPQSTTHSRFFSSAKLADSFFAMCARRIVVWLDIALRFSGKECATTLDCYLFLTDDLKKVPKPPVQHIETTEGGSKSITPKHANTAFTYSCVPSSKIVLFRMEEWFKVFIHESFHCFGLDFSQMNIAESNRHMSKLFPKCHSNMDFRIYETYCETWAETINAVFVAYNQEPHLGHGRRSLRGNREYSQKHTRKITGKDTVKHRTRTYTLGQTHIIHIIKQIEHIIQRERMFSLFQMSKVLHHRELQYTDLCYSRTKRSSDDVRSFVGELCSTLEIDSTKTDQTPYTEETQVFAYYIVKPILLFYLNEFIEWCHRHNGSSTVLFFKKTDGNIREYGNLIERLYMLPEFINIVKNESNTYSRYISSNVHKSSHKFNIKDTLRMSLYEI